MYKTLLAFLLLFLMNSCGPEPTLPLAQLNEIKSLKKVVLHICSIIGLPQNWDTKYVGKSRGKFQNISRQLHEIELIQPRPFRGRLSAMSRFYFETNMSAAKYIS